MPYSPILEGKRPSSPTIGGWQRTDMKVGVAKSWGLVPRDSTLNENLSYNLAWHHNIPWADLRDSWNVVFSFCAKATVEKLFDLYAEGNGTLTPEAHRSLRTKLLGIKESLDEKEPAGADRYVDCINRLKVGGGDFLSRLPVEKQLGSNDSENLALIVAWQRWNIVEGPKESVRTDDPGSDDFDDFRKVDRRKQFLRFVTIFELYEALGWVKSSYTIAMQDKCSREIISGWQARADRALNGAAWLADKKVTPIQKKYWIPVDQKGKLPKIDGKEFCWVKRNEKPDSA